MTDSCSDPNFCRMGCCRNFLGREFCDVESNCFVQPTWIIALVPAALGICALILIILVVIRMRNRVTVRQVSNPFKYLSYYQANPEGRTWKKTTM